MGRKKKEIDLVAYKNEILKRFSPRAEVIPIHLYEGKKIKLGLLSDTHLGSFHENCGLLKTAYTVFEREHASAIYHAGDLCEGERMFRGQEYEIYAHGADAQVKNAVKKYPLTDIPTYFITGSHDLSFYKTSGIDIGDHISTARPELHYLGRESANVVIKVGDNQIILQLVHPGKGTAYAISYHPQKYIEALTGGEKPNILVIGHYHKAEFLFYRNIFTIQTGCCQHQTPFMRRQNLAAMQGFWIIEFTVNGKGSVCNFKPEFFPYYEGLKK